MKDYDNARSGMLAGVVLGAFGALACGLLGAAGLVDLAWALLDGRRIPMTGLLVAGVGLPGALGFGFLSFSSWRTLGRWQRINERPIMAWGILGEPRRTNSKINRRHLYDLPVSITPPQGAPFPATVSWFLPVDVREMAKVGARVIVRLDPETPGFALVDWEQTRASWGLPQPSP